jgi:hypothetical protein
MIIKVGGLLFKIEPAVEQAIERAIAVTLNDIEETWPDRPTVEREAAAIKIVSAYLEQRKAPA